MIDIEKRARNSLKRTCKGCKALIREYGTITPYRCRIGYEIDRVEGKPLTPCPKPKTNMDFINLYQVKDKYGLNLDGLARWKFT